MQVLGADHRCRRASVGGGARVHSGVATGRLGCLCGGLTAVDRHVAVDDEARFRREEPGHR